MGTRGAYGFRKNDKDKVSYNHFDSYPDCLGKSVIDFVKKHSIEELNSICDRIEMVDSQSKPSEEQKAICASKTNLTVGNQDVNDWYCLLREAQGDMESLVDIPIMIDSNSFMIDSLLCKYAYLINLDTNELEVYKGFNKDADEAGRYASLKEPDYKRDDGTIYKTEYYGVKLVHTIPLDKIDEFDETSLAEINQKCEESPDDY